MNKNDGKKQLLNDMFGDESDYNEFYNSISVLFRVISFLLFASFLLFIISSAFAGAEDFSYDNFEYIIRNFALRLEENRDGSRHAIQYDKEGGRRFALFGQGLAIFSPSALAIFSATGRKTLSESLMYTDPVMKTSDKFVLVFDSGNSGYTVFNSFTDVHSDEHEYEILGADIADNGSFALITLSDAHNSVVEVYNSDFQKVNALNRTDHVSCVDISDTSVLAATTGVNTTDGYQTKLISFDIGADEIRYEISLDTSFPMMCKITERGATLVCTDSIVFVDNEGNIIGRYEIGNGLYDIRVDDSGVLLLFKKSGFHTEYEMVYLSYQCKVEYSRIIAATVFDVELKNGISYILTENQIICIDGDTESTFTVSEISHDTEILAYGDYVVYLCKDTAAEVVSFSD